MTTALAKLFFEYEESVSLYLETHDPAAKAAVLRLRAEFVGLLLAYDLIQVADIEKFKAIPHWLQEG